ncbi:hypothetical protein CFC21_063871 [Triticum aestivum]|uniref:Uncharacterized protein n=3 Tax=Triticum TaxID=4564 RepID=A0A9R0WHV3_TRITD|nr:uncharacterized protein At1g76660-like isoform X1 [Triticum aestivum]KAF7056471.1 hypothetical protein CFC21_063871 [Triticum aestivum]VAI12237.1 unnamed protein product [Triticum turgidum subsp. durum]
MAAPGSSNGGGGSRSQQQQQPQQDKQSIWAGCFSGLSCFGAQKGGKRIVPAARMPDGSASTNRGNAQSGGNPNQNGAMNLSLLAPPSSPASFSNSALPSTAQSPNCFLSISANSPGGPTSNMFAVGPYANEPQLVSPPAAFSTYTTEPSTAPLTPPPELAHATTPSSPDVPYAQFLSSSMGLKTAGKEHNMHYYSGGSGLQGPYPLYQPGSPSSSLISPASVTPRTGLSSPIPEQNVPTAAHWKTSRSACDTPYSIASPIPEQEVPTAHWKTSRSACDTPYSRTSPSNIFGLDSAATRNSLLDSNFFRPAASAQFYLDQAYNGGKLSVSRDKQQDADEVEAYRASFGFSADEMVTSTQRYAEAPDATLDEGFSISPFGNNAPANNTEEVRPFNELRNDEVQKVGKMSRSLSNAKEMMTSPSKKPADQLQHKAVYLDIFKGTKGGYLSEDDTSAVKDCHPFRMTRDEISLKPIEVRKKAPAGQACSDAEVEFRRARSLREANSVLSWRSTLSRQLQ